MILLAIAASYFLWAELVVGPFNTSPIGTVTTGLPYPFLNSMELAERVTYYATNTALAVIALMIFFVLGWASVRIFGDRP